MRYKVTVIAPGVDAGRPPVLLVPFQPDALVTAFIDELFRRIARLNLPLQPDTHVATLHLDSETGAILDCEDLLSDVVAEDEKEKLFMVLKEKQASLQTAAKPAQQTSISGQEETIIPPAKGHVRVRVVTPSRARQTAEQTADHYVSVPSNGSIREMHQKIASHLGVPEASVDEADTNECNCKLAAKLGNDAQTANQVKVLLSKSELQHLTIAVPFEAAIKQALRATFGNDLENKKKVVFVGGQRDVTTPGLFTKLPTIAICSKHRHTPAHARADVDDEVPSKNTKILDLHSTEGPIHSAGMQSTLQESGLLALAENDVLTVFAVVRKRGSTKAPAAGKNSIFRSRTHWQPEVKQSERGVPMFLSSLRVAASLVEGMADDDRAQDAVLHVIDLLTNFPPAVRAFYVLIQGRTPISAECAALAHAMFEVLGSFLPTSLLGSNRTRLFEGSRLLFGFVLESAKALKLPEQTAATPYLSAFDTVDIRDYKTFEPVLHVVNTDKGALERCLFQALQEGGPLATSQLQDFPVQAGDSATQVRVALLSGGCVGDVVAFSMQSLRAAYAYDDNGCVEAALDLNELSELEHLAELCGRNKLAVHRPSQLTSAITPCLTFDRDAHVAVYLGDQGCGAPGQSSLVFQPKHGELTVDTAVVEQLIAPIIRRYEADGTAVLDAVGGAAVRRLQQPDEILMFCVDCSASMRQSTDFHEVNDEVNFPSSLESDAQSLVAGDFYNRLSFDSLKQRLAEYESFKDMVAIITEASDNNRRAAASGVYQILRTMLSNQIVQLTKELEDLRSRAYTWYSARAAASAKERELDRVKEFWAGLKTHETTVGDFLMYRALMDSRDVAQRWYWSISDPTPTMMPVQQLPSLPNEVIEIPEDLRCPISHTLMEDAVAASDGFNYARSALMQWYSIRKSSPMTGLPIQDTSLQTNSGICDAAAAWVRGDGLYQDGDQSPARDDQQPDKKRQRSSDHLEVVFDSRIGSFKRKLCPSMSLEEVYKLVFRGLQARHSVFQLSSERCGTILPRPTTLVSSTQIENGQHITVRIADDEPSTSQGASSAASGYASETCLVKVYESTNTMLFGFWTDRSRTTQTLATILWKYWRWTFSQYSYGTPSVRDKQVWTNMIHSGDGLLRGNAQESTDRLAKYLNRNHCFGRLATEKVYREEADYSNAHGTLVLKVKVCAPRRSKKNDGRLTRLDVLKQMFEATINRMIAYNYKTHVGLVTVASKANISMHVSHVMENLRRATNEMKAEGDTSLWDALALAKDQIVEYSKKYPTAKKRIVCISDGEDTTSMTNTASDICWRLREADIAVDTVVLGSDDNRDLRTISHLLGCYILQPKSLANALAMCEMEPFLSLIDRPTITPPTDTPRARIPFMAKFLNARTRGRSTKVDEDTVPPIKKHPNLDDDFVQLTAMASRPVNTNNTATGSRGRLRISRLLNEIKSMAADEGGRKYDVYVSESDFSFWKVVMEGPDGSPYAAGTFMLYMHAEDTYPSSAPKARFITKIRHPNVNPNGRACHSIFDRDWTSDTSMTTLLDTIYGLLMQPEHSDPVNTTITLGFHHDEVEFADEVRHHVQKHALKTREQWRAELLGEVPAARGEEDEEEYDDNTDDVDSYEDSELYEDDYLFADGGFLVGDEIGAGDGLGEDGESSEDDDDVDEDDVSNVSD